MVPATQGNEVKNSLSRKKRSIAKQSIPLPCILVLFQVVSCGVFACAVQFDQILHLAPTQKGWGETYIRSKVNGSVSQSPSKFQETTKNIESFHPSRFTRRQKAKNLHGNRR